MDMQYWRLCLSFPPNNQITEEADQLVGEEEDQTPKERWGIMEEDSNFLVAGMQKAMDEMPSFKGTFPVTPPPLQTSS